MPLEKTKITEERLIWSSALFLLIFCNVSFYRQVLVVYPLQWSNALYLVSLSFLLYGVIVLLISLVASPWTTKGVIIFMLLSAAAASYYMDTFNVVFDTEMYENIFKTNIHEAQDLVNGRFILTFLLLGILPSIYVWRQKLVYKSFKQQGLFKLKILAIVILLSVSQLLLFSKFYASFFREHKPLRYYTNPTYLIYSGLKYSTDSIKSKATPYQPMGLDAKIAYSSLRKNLFIFVAGETARADHFSINGYTRETNPLLKKENIINFPQFTSSFTSTAQSLPCMFSTLRSDEYDHKKGKNRDNLLDLLHRAGIAVLWRENNTGSQNVADRVTFQDYSNSKVNPICDIEPRDEGMLVGLQEYIDQHQDQSVFIVLHQLGNHGPAYHKRYPKEFEKFTPAQTTSQLNECTQEEIINAYDNAILYTDYFLSKVISLLKANESKYNAAMFYVSDHGESLGENGIYLHGLPNFMAPNVQRHVPAIFWLGQKHFVTPSQILLIREQSWNHDIIFHTMLSFMEVKTELYKPEWDLLSAKPFAIRQL